VRSKGPPIIDLKGPDELTRPIERELLDALREANDEHLASRGDNSHLAARIASYELAYKMQQYAPEAVDLGQESADTLGTLRRRCGSHPRFRPPLPAGAATGRAGRALRAALFGRRPQRLELGRPRRSGGEPQLPCRQHRPANRRTVERSQAARAVGRDAGRLGRRVGRQPTAEYAKGTGRDHNAYGFTMWMAGGGTKGGQSYGATDELGASAVESPLHVKRLHATILHQLGLDPNKLSYFYGGLDQKLVGVEHVEPIRQVIG